MATIEKLKNLINSIISKCNEVTGKSHTNVESCTNYLLSVYCKDIIERKDITEITVPTGLEVLGAYSFYNLRVHSVSLKRAVKVNNVQTLES